LRKLREQPRMRERLRVSDATGSDRKIVVLKLGGSVLTGSKAFRRAALFLKRRLERDAAEKLVVVVSAQKLATDALERRARGILREPSVRALDLLWSTGELRSVALLALHLQAASVSTVGLNVHETGLQFSGAEQGYSARPKLTGRHLESALTEHPVVIVPGFLAARSDGAMVSLGRGGSDFSAVLLAIGLRAARCELIKDVAGYFEEDPNRNASAVHLPRVSFEKAIAMARAGCELVQMRALLAAGEARLALRIRSMDERGPVTEISWHPKTEDAEPRDEMVAAET
jgi:aspartate kinase